MCGVNKIAMDAHAASEGFRGPHNKSLPVLPRLPAAAYPSTSVFRGRSAVLGEVRYHYCPQCGGWVEGEASEMTGGWQDGDGVHWATTYHCRRCGEVIHDDC